MLRTVLLVIVCTLSFPAAGQVSYCRDIGGGKTYCSGGTLIHRHGGTTIVQDHVEPLQAAPLLPDPMARQPAAAGMGAPYPGVIRQGGPPASPAVIIAPSTARGTQAAPLVVVPSSRSGRICHQFGNTLVCD